MGQLSKREGDNCSNRSDAATAELGSYYAQIGVLSYNLEEALQTMLTLITARGKMPVWKTDKKFSDLFRQPL